MFLALRLGALAAVGTALGVTGYAVASRDTALAKLHARYVARLDATLRVLFRREAGRTIALVQAAAIGLVVALQVAVGVPYWPIWIALVALGPAVYLERERRKRIERLETQVDGFMVAFANSLKTVPSPQAALHAVTTVLPQPMRQEMEHVLKEVRLGSTLEEALLAMSARVKSRWVDVAFSAVLIGLRVGGNLPAVLEQTAANVREMNRLLGVVRTKTGEGRAQLWVLALFPMFVVVAFDFVQKGYFDPLRTAFVGQVAIGFAAVLWIASLFLARKILAVDI